MNRSLRSGAPGAYLVAGTLLRRRRRSNCISSAAGDSADIADHLDETPQHRAVGRIVPA